MKNVRCAIYTRKSSEEGLEQGFNSLDAQREACAAYILSQASEGWATLPEFYDDGGISGGTLERPALKRLLTDVADGKIDVIVVYKVDRLSRSLFDFAKLVEAFEKAGTSFVSITQAFNTTSSMGRLTFNMLLSFAQFEREVTAERIRDKIAASKAKGMWMGGIPPIGYRPDGRSLAIVDKDAALIRDIYQRYLDAESVYALVDDLQIAGIVTPRRVVAKSGREHGGVPFTRNQLYGVLRNRTYIGEVVHRDQVHKGLHEPIIDRDLWDAVQAKHGEPRTHSTYEANRSLLAGKVIDERGEPLIPMHSVGRSNRRYSYYVSRALHQGKSTKGMRLPAREIDALVLDQLATALADPIEAMDRFGLEVAADDFHRLSASADLLVARVRRRERDFVRSIIQQVRVLPTAVEISLDRDQLAEFLDAEIVDDNAAAILPIAMRLKRSGRAVRMAQGESRVEGEPDRALIRLLARARGYWIELRKGERNITELAATENISPAYLTRLLRLALLSPKLVDAILAGRQPAAATAFSLTQTDAVAPFWADQTAMMSVTSTRSSPM